jgi:uncharacterized membrane protein YphA (DoxX/SURF4 family)
MRADHEDEHARFETRAGVVVTAEPTRVTGARDMALLKPPWWIAAVAGLATVAAIASLAAGSSRPWTHWIGWAFASVALFCALAFWKTDRRRRLSRRYSPSALVGPVALVLIILAIALIGVHAWYLARWLAV